jgi:hypothetical protein
MEFVLWLFFRLLLPFKMSVKADQDRVKTLLRDTITLLCKNGLAFKDKFSIDAVIGVTIDEEDVFLVSMNEIVKTDRPAPPSSDDREDETLSHSTQSNHRRHRKRKRVKTEIGIASTEPEEIIDSSEDDQGGEFPPIDDSNSEFAGIPAIKRQRDDTDLSPNGGGHVDNGTDKKIIMQIKEEVDDSVWTGNNEAGASQQQNMLPDFVGTNYGSQDLSGVTFMPGTSQEQWLQQSEMMSPINSCSSMPRVPRTATVTSDADLSQSIEGHSINRGQEFSEQVGAKFCSLSFGVEQINSLQLSMTKNSIVVCC